jgi:hypothetical protein
MLCHDCSLQRRTERNRRTRSRSAWTRTGCNCKALVVVFPPLRRRCPGGGAGCPLRRCIAICDRGRAGTWRRRLHISSYAELRVRHFGHSSRVSIGQLVGLPMRPLYDAGLRILCTAAFAESAQPGLDHGSVLVCVVRPLRQKRNQSSPCVWPHLHAYRQSPTVPLECALRTHRGPLEHALSTPGPPFDSRGIGSMKGRRGRELSRRARAAAADGALRRLPRATVGPHQPRHVSGGSAHCRQMCRSRQRTWPTIAC